MIIKGIASWASLSTPDTRYDPTYTITLTVTDEEKAKAEAEFDKACEGDKSFKKPNFKKTEDGLWQIRVKQSFYGRDGEERPPIVVVDSQKNPLENVQVGNGSVVRVIVAVRATTNKFGKFVSAYLNKVQVLELVEYISEDFDEIPNSVSDSSEDEEF